jgi:hypothetical protein
LCDEAISAVTPGDCFGKKRLAMTVFSIFGQNLINSLQEKYLRAIPDSAFTASAAVSKKV